MGVGRFPYQLDPPAVIEACEAAIEREPNAGRFHYQLGRGLLAERRFHEAEAAYRRARDLGHTRGWHALGLATYMRGFQTGGLSREVPMSEESRALLARGVIEGDPFAMYSLGRDLMRHGTTTVVQIEGYDLMTRAMEVGHTYAMTELARYYLDEESTYHDPERGVRYLQESAARGDIYGMNSLGFSFLDGEGGIVQDKARAAELFATAAEGGHPTAPYNLGLMYFDGDVTGSPAPEEAVALFQTGLERGHALSGAMGAYVIRAAQPEGYDAFDAGVMAAKGAALENSEFAPDALSQLTAMPGQVIDGAAQKLILELGGTLSTVDGAFGPESDRAYAAVLEARGIAASEAKTDPVERAIHLAGLVWDESPFRTDLY
jgi:TPR repeat protein